MAWKFSASEAVTTLTGFGVYWSRPGVLAPTALLHPVLLQARSTVSSQASVSALELIYYQLCRCRCRCRHRRHRRRRRRCCRRRCQRFHDHLLLPQGETVSRVSLDHVGAIIDQDLRIGDKVIIKRADDASLSVRNFFQASKTVRFIP